ncbi:MAG: amidohydrolase family protein [Opitutaceae bacterium]
MRSRVIDAHVHLYPPETNADPAGWAAARGEAHWSKLATRRRRSGRPVQTFPSLKELLASMDAANIERAVLQGWYWEDPRTCLEQNRFYRDCLRAHPDRIAACVSLHARMAEGQLEAELVWARDSGFRGVGELSPHSQGYGLDHPGLEAALSLAGEWGWPVVLHVSDPAGRGYPGRVETPLEDFLALAGNFPKTAFVLAHWGGLLALRPGAGRHRNLYYDTAASPLLYEPTVWRRIADAAGADRILFGSDFPLNVFPGLEAEPGWDRLLAEARSAGLPPGELAAVLGGNAERWFG